MALIPAAAQAASGDLDESFGDRGSFISHRGELATTLVVDGYGRHLTVLYDGANDYLNVAAYQENGSLDQSWGIDGIATVPLTGFEAVVPGPGDSMALDSEGRLLVTGTMAGPGDDPDREGFVARLLPDGSPDPEFGDGGVAGDLLFSPVALTLSGDRPVVVTGASIQRLTESGELDQDFGNDGTFTIPHPPSEQPCNPGLYCENGFRTYSVAVRDVGAGPDGSIVVVGVRYFPFADGGNPVLVGVSEDGTATAGFGTGGFRVDLAVRGRLDAVEALSDGSFLTAGPQGHASDDEKTMARRYSPTGEPDLDYGSGGSFSDGALPWARQWDRELNLLPDGRAMVTAGLAEPDDLGAVRLTADGELDPTFGTGGRSRIDFAGYRFALSASALDPEGRLVVAGRYSEPGFPDYVMLARVLGGDDPRTEEPPPDPDEPAPADGGGGAVAGEVSAGPGLEILSRRIPKRLSKLATKGVVVRARCAADCRMFIRVVIPQKQANQLGLSSRVIAGAERDARGGEVVRLVSRLSATAKLRLLAANPKVLRVGVQGTADPR